MSDPQNVTIVGGGLAGAKTAEALREKGYVGEIVLVAAEAHPPYERPPLSKDYLAGKAGFDDAIVHPEDWYRDHDVTLREGVRATGIDTAAHRVDLDDGTALGYGALVLATGSEPRRLDIRGIDAGHVHVLRTVEDSDAIRAEFGPGRRLVLIGGGWIGLEVAAAARGAGTEVTVLEGAHLPLLRVLGAQLAEVFAGLHRENGVDLRTDARIAALESADGAVTGVRMDDGEIIPADAVVVGVGVRPVTELAEKAGLAVDDGVLVDALLRTSDPDVYAVGDIANHEHPVLDRRVRVEHWANALNQPAAVAATLTGVDTAYTELPYFFSDQYDLGMEYIGHAPEGSYDRVVIRGDLASREFVAFWLDGEDRIQAAMNVNVWDVPDAVKPLIVAKTSVDPARLADPDIAYADL
ncbi:FAD-dependent oxidoreductase [Microbacterium pseudoresistens]|uniref:NADPH-dependent 2,4-dienoyl-CoA reductase/sulfur reductase-like enzyme n=1 Tax=Microbacterium pseudoresistens TaxID=640634 RepID=A0A7Y9EUF7_9MICO|nr:FAD-dependent oxidoreductase [Microbacterium pseudoresistens]NYD54041.1 NADPH-dependent 2,4-dienoyl-CoA reductase/sulfur reductase-like enzyme [Microbacterium pseudoresistens]